MLKPFFFSALLFVISWDAIAQFSLGADIRPRAEYRRGYQSMPGPDDKAAGHVSQRTRLILDFSSEHVKTKVSLQDVRLWGQHLPFGQTGALDLHEAWLQVALGDQLYLKAGRQEIRYDNQRFFAFNDWHQAGQKHDAVVLGHDHEKGAFHVGAAYNQKENRLFGSQYNMNNYKTLNYIWYKTRLGNGLNLSLLALADGYEQPGNPEKLQFSFTGSAYLDLNSGKITVRANPAYQTGKTPGGDDIAAWYLLLEATAEMTGNFRTTTGVEVFSGINFDSPDGKYRAFSTPYGAGHIVHGYMDYFINIPAHTRGAGLVNPYLKNRFRLSSGATFDADLHLFFLQNNYVHQGQVIDRYLGTEVDFTYTRSINPVTTLVLGYSVMFGSESMEVIKGGSKDEFAQWGFVMIRVRPGFL